MEGEHYFPPMQSTATELWKAKNRELLGFGTCEDHGAALPALPAGGKDPGVSATDLRFGSDALGQMVGQASVHFRQEVFEGQD